MKLSYFSFALAALVSTSAFARTIDAYVYAGDCPANSICVQKGGMTQDGTIFVSALLDTSANVYIQPHQSTVVIKEGNLLVNGTRIGTVENVNAVNGNHRVQLEQGVSLNISTAQGPDIIVPRKICVAVDVCQTFGTKRLPGLIDTLTVNGDQELSVQSDPYSLQQ